MHILKTIRNNWLNQKSEAKIFSFPDFDNISIDQCTYPLSLCYASFRDIRILYNYERYILAKLAQRLTLKSCYPSSLERQNVKLLLKIVHEATIAALIIQNDLRYTAYKTHTSVFVELLLSLWKIFMTSVNWKLVSAPRRLP